MNKYILVALVGLAAFAAVAEAVSADASHILVPDEAKCNELKAQITAAADPLAKFQELAKEHSTCPSGRSGGSLGTFQPGQMVKEFNDVVFETGTVGKVEGPVKTQFGYHLIYITKRA
mmetsp:Transcript_43709/g.106856  ORF Transcript_43709/g.106856 Transcript_43709/m.106856 type:complete len:118 (-) Transcript_43709:272-625(-)